MVSNEHLEDGCLFCKIIRGDIPSYKLAETEKSFAFLDIGPLSDGHALVIPKYHAVFAHELPDDYLADILPLTKKVTNALIEYTGVDQYNLLQNNGKRAHQEVEHVHFHIIPKPPKIKEDDSEKGLVLQWTQGTLNKDEAFKLTESVKQKFQ